MDAIVHTCFVRKLGVRVGHSGSCGFKHGFCWYPVVMPAYQHNNVNIGHGTDNVRWRQRSRRVLRVGEVGNEQTLAADAARLIASSRHVQLQTSSMTGTERYEQTEMHKHRHPKSRSNWSKTRVRKTRYRVGFRLGQSLFISQAVSRVTTPRGPPAPNRCPDTSIPHTGSVGGHTMDDNQLRLGTRKSWRRLLESAPIHDVFRSVSQYTAKRK